MAPQSAVSFLAVKIKDKRLLASPRQLRALARPRTSPDSWAPIPLPVRGLYAQLTVDLFCGLPLWCVELSYESRPYWTREQVSVWFRSQMSRALESGVTMIEDVGEGKIVVIKRVRSILVVRPLTLEERLRAQENARKDPYAVAMAS